MNTQIRVIVTIVVLATLVFGLFLFSDWFSKTTGYFLGEDQKTLFFLCLKEKNTIFYTQDYKKCAECYKQEEIFGSETFELVEKVICEGDLCSNLQSIPAWEINGRFYYGKKNFNELEKISGCKIE